jgi:hypothetical protein
MRFKEHLTPAACRGTLKDASVEIRSSSHVLYLTLDKQDIITDASFEGPHDPWLAATITLIKGKTSNEAQNLSKNDWESAFGSEQAYWDLWSEKENDIFFRPHELVHAALDKYHGKDHLYLRASPLVCRCFGVREDEITIGAVTKAGMGCRSCKGDIEKLLKQKSNTKKRHYKHLSNADWLVLADERLQGFSDGHDWNLEVQGWKGQGMVITYTKKVSQKEEEDMARKLQDFLAGALDSDLAFFLRRA